MRGCGSIWAKADSPSSRCGGRTGPNRGNAISSRLKLAGGLIIKPGWSRRRARPGQRVVILDPGLSFGTGQHPTTLFCLQQLARFRRRGAAVVPGYRLRLGHPGHRRRKTGLQSRRGVRQRPGGRSRQPPKHQAEPRRVALRRADLTRLPRGSPAALRRDLRQFDLRPAGHGGGENPQLAQTGRETGGSRHPAREFPKLEKNCTNLT
jgi:hypothetical protein